MLFDIDSEDVRVTSIDSSKQDMSQGSSPIDSMSLMQSAPIHVDHLSTQSKVSSSAEQAEKDDATAIDDDTSLFSGAPIRVKVKARQTRPAASSLMSTSQRVSSAASHFASLALGLRVALREKMQGRFGRFGAAASSMEVAAVVMIIMLVCCTGGAVLSIIFPSKFGFRAERDEKPEVQPSLASVLEQRELMLNMRPGSQKQGSKQPNGNGSVQAVQSPNMFQMSPNASVQNLRPNVPSPFASAFLPTPAGTFNQVPANSQLSLQPTQPQHIPDDAPRPPPLCPRLVMPVCEARFGIPMYELAQLSAEGELNIVGLSGNPLLRAVVRKIGIARTLEISMPEQNSAPRATISPSTNELAGRSQQGSRALEIRGIRGAFYGILEMRSSGACYVVKDNQTVLTIDGDAGTLQLSIKSSVGLQLASVRCSAEPFGGVDHVELRVEPAVDTVLVVSVVLAVLLLSPYLADGTQ